MRLLICVAIMLWSALPAQAEFRVYLVPVVTDGNGSRAPKYFSDGAIVPRGWSGVYYGIENWALVGANLSAADDAVVVGAADGFGLPYDLTQTLTAGQVAAVSTRLEAAKIPAQWVTTSLTWRQVLRTTIGMSMILQRLSGVNATNFFGVTTLDGTISALPAGVRTDLLAVADAFGLDRSGITGTTTIRQALMITGEQLRNGSRQFVFNNVTY